MKLYNLISLCTLVFVTTACSIDSLNPFKSSKPTYYIAGEEIEGKRELTPKSQSFPKGGYTSAARHKATMRPYCVKGEYYHPTYVQVGDSMTGIASWYGPNFHGKQTSNGEYYNMYDMTVAHKTWPMDTMVKITNLDNGKTAIARVNDRGPFVPGRIVDCSYAVGKKIGIDKKGTCHVRLDVIGFAGKVYKPTSGKKKPKVRLNNFGIQVGVYSLYENALRTKKRYENMVCAPLKVVIKEKREPFKGKLYSVFITGFDSKEAAQSFIDEQGISGAFIIRGVK
jgi:rare lipoprotein A